MNTVVARANTNPVNEQHQCAVRSAVAAFSKTLLTNDAKDVAIATEALIRAVAQNPHSIDSAASPKDSALATLDPSLLATSYHGRTQFFSVLRSRVSQLRASPIYSDNINSFGANSSGSKLQEIAAISTILHHVATFESRPENLFVRLTALKDLNHPSATPLVSSLNVLVTAADSEVKARAIAYLMEHLTFPLSSAARQELQAAHTVGGELLGKLCQNVDTARGRPSWMTAFPRLVQQWQLACSGARLESGISQADMNACMLANKGPLNACQVRYALSPTDPLSLAFFQAGLRRLVGF